MLNATKQVIFTQRPAPVYRSFGSVASGAAASTVDVTNLTVSADYDRPALVVAVSTQSGNNSIGSIVWDSAGVAQNLTLIGTQTNNSATVHHELWGLVNPVTGNKTLTTTLASGTSTIRVIAMAFSGVNQNYEKAFPHSNTDRTTGGSYTARVESANNHLIAGSFAGQGPGTFTVPTMTQIALYGGNIGGAWSMNVQKPQAFTTIPYTFSNSNIAHIVTDIAP